MFETIQKNFLFDEKGPLIPNINWSGISLPSGHEIIEFHFRQEHEQEIYNWDDNNENMGIITEGLNRHLIWLREKKGKIL